MTRGRGVVFRNSMLVQGISAIMWYIAGFSLTFGPNSLDMTIITQPNFTNNLAQPDLKNNTFIGNFDYSALHSIGNNDYSVYSDQLNTLTLFLFQMVPACTIPCLVLNNFIKKIASIMKIWQPQ